jgi:hypothetical protein
VASASCSSALTISPPPAGSCNSDLKQSGADNGTGNPFPPVHDLGIAVWCGGTLANVVALSKALGPPGTQTSSAPWRTKVAAVEICRSTIPRCAGISPPTKMRLHFATTCQAPITQRCVKSLERSHQDFV